MEDKDIELAYRIGFLDGLESYAWMKDGVLYVGTTGKSLRQAKNEIDKTWNFRPSAHSIMKGRRWRK